MLIQAHPNGTLLSLKLPRQTASTQKLEFVESWLIFKMSQGNYLREAKGRYQTLVLRFFMLPIAALKFDNGLKSWWAERSDFGKISYIILAINTRMRTKPVDLGILRFAQYFKVKQTFQHLKHQTFLHQLWNTLLPRVKQQSPLW